MEETGKMKVGQAVRLLLDQDQDADLIICGHAFPGMEDRGWHVAAFEPVQGAPVVLIEGAGPQQ